MTPEQRDKVVKALQDAGFGDADYSGGQNGGQFNLQKITGRRERVLYIRENSLAIGFYGFAYETMRQWADSEIATFADKELPDWECFRLKKQKKPEGDKAVWFNLRPKSKQKRNWSERVAEVIGTAVKLYKKLNAEKIFENDFDPNNYAVVNTGNQTERVMKNESVVEFTVKSLLEANLNVILTGAPGTGKTYTAKEVAKAMVGAKVSENATDDEKKRAKSVEKERIESVQFHPGYDYSDFVVGMKPVLIFEGKKVFRDTQGFYTKRDEKKEKYAEKNIEKRLSVGSKTEVSFLWEDGIFKKFADKAKKAYEEWVSIDGHKPEDAPKFVFLIDEINRADLSRVFGELFSLLEEEYRYPNGKGTGITLPNGENFVIPRNLYILGTMNDIDRSVESMDFALRRRFAWKEVKATDTQNDILDALDKNGTRKIAEPEANKLKVAMQALNDRIGGKTKLKLENEPETDLRLGTAYQLGGAIFAKFEKCNGDFDALWNNHISNVLGEYLRGHRYRDDILIALRGIFDDAIKESVGEQSSAQTHEAPTAPTGQQAAPQA